MKTTSKSKKGPNHIMLLGLALAGCALTLTAQDAGAPPPDAPPPQIGGSGDAPHPGPRGHRPPPSVLMIALDANEDGILDEQEIANAAEALKKLDKNGDGKLTRDELRPPPPPGENGQGGPGLRRPPCHDPQSEDASPQTPQQPAEQ